MEPTHRRDVVRRFIETGQAGDLAGFVSAMIAIDWPSAWRDVLAAVANAGPIHADMRLVFRAAWHGWLIEPDLPIIGTRNRWNLSLDLADDLDLVWVMRDLLPDDSAPAPYALFRGGPLAEYEAGTHGVWWSAEPTYAEFYARDPGRSRQGVVVATIVPGDAIVATWPAP